MSAAPPLAAEALARIARGLPAFEATALAPGHVRLRRDAIQWLFRQRLMVRDEARSGETGDYVVVVSPGRYPAPDRELKRKHVGKTSIVLPVVTDAGRKFLAALPANASARN